VKVFLLISAAQYSVREC